MLPPLPACAWGWDAAQGQGCSFPVVCSIFLQKTVSWEMWPCESSILLTVGQPCSFPQAVISLSGEHLPSPGQTSQGHIPSTEPAPSLPVALSKCSNCKCLILNILSSI